MYSEMPELFLIKDDKEDLSNLEIVKRTTLKFQSESTESLSSSSHSQNKEEENNGQEKEGEEQEGEHHLSRIVSKQSHSVPSTSSSRLKLKVEEEEEEDDGFRTPTSLDHRIPVAKQCPPAPKKIKPSLKRKASYNHCSYRQPLDLSKEVELLFPTQHFPLSDSDQSTKKVRRQEPK